MSGQLEKVLFNVDRDDGSVVVESLWARSEPGGYRLDSIPFYVRNFACEDIVSVAVTQHGSLQCTGLVAASGHSTIRLWFARQEDVQAVREELRRMSCSSELDLSRLVAVDIPPGVPYKTICEYLLVKEASGMLEYEEACLGQHTR
jgi:hypothetical protein